MLGLRNRIALVLGGGGLKGFAHIGVLRALLEHSVHPAVYAGTSIGSLIAAAHVGGMSIDEMVRRATTLRRKDLFRINRVEMLFERFRSRSIYEAEPLHAIVDSIVPHARFDELDDRLLVNTVDIERGTQVVWGLPGLRDATVNDAVYASCALPGYFPPGRVNGRSCIDGGTVDNLPVNIAGLGMDAIIAVDVGSFELLRTAEIEKQGFASVYMRAATVMMHTLQEPPLTSWSGPPLLLIRPKVAHVGLFGFGSTAEVIEQGYQAAKAALEHVEQWLAAPSGVFPRRTVRLSVVRPKCIGCGTCVALAPGLMQLDADGRAYAVTPSLVWSPADGEFVRHCPTDAILAEDELGPQTAGASAQENVTDLGR